MVKLVKTLVMGFVIFMGVATVSAQKLKPLDALYDKKKNETTVYLSEFVKVTDLTSDLASELDRITKEKTYTQPETLRMVVFFKSPGASPAIPDRLIVQFTSFSKGDYRWLKDRSFGATADSVKFDFGQMDRTDNHVNMAGGVNDTMYMEVLQKSIGLRDYARIIRSKDVRLTLGDIEFKLSTKTLEMFGGYLDRLLQ